MSVSRWVDEEVNGITKQKLIGVLDDVRCHLSITSVPIPSSNGQHIVQQNIYTLFTKPEYNVLPGDTIVVTTSHEVKHILIAGMPKVYDMSQQIPCSEEFNQ
ncbi:MAG: hypothetical protein ACK5L6_10180 [Anaerorhabdus sp.]|uniref:hypothetical protein n=1 Tax=Anaerorhabdus sp. TaxID=1872524 RepID=UPI003A8A1DE3